MAKKSNEIAGAKQMLSTQQSEEEYKVGYKNPPKAKRFKKGTSGNPKGRPIRRLTLEESFLKVFNSRLDATIDGEQMKVSGTEAGFWKLRSHILRGNLAAMRLFLDYYLRLNIRNVGGEENTQLQGLFDALMRGPVETDR